MLFPFSNVKQSLRHFVYFLVWFWAITVSPHYAYGQIFTIADQQKISATTGNFGGQLRDTDGFGGAIEVLGDLDGDGITDIAVGASDDNDGGTGHGAVWILFLNANGTVKSHQKISDTEGGFLDSLNDFDLFGFSIANLNDLDGDGITDIAVGAPNHSSGGTFNGAVWILFLNKNGTVKSHQKISKIDGNFTGTLLRSDFFGCSLTPLGDLNSDGIIDLAVGAMGDDDGGANQGAVWILFLNSDGTVKTQQKISDTQGNFTGDLKTRTVFTNSGVSQEGDFFGSAIASLGDLNDDDITDLAVGALRDSDNDPNSGAVWILFLNNDGTVKTHQKINSTQGNFTGELKGRDFIGNGLAFLNDLDGDGSIELAVGAQGDDDDAENSGAVWILSLDNDGTVKTHQKISASIDNIHSASTGDLFGLGVIGIDEKDPNGIVKMAIGSPGDEGGAVWILSLQTPIPSLSLPTDALDFGPLKAGSSGTKQLIISNTGDGQLNLSNITTSNTQFTVSSTSLGILPASQDTLTVTFSPHPDSLRNINGVQATLRFQTNDAKNLQAEVTLSGQMPRVDPQINVSISNINFGRVVKTGSTGTVTFDISNTGSNDLVVSNVSTSNDAHTVTPEQATIPWNMSQTFEFTFRPIVEGDYTATLTIASNDPDNAVIEIPIRAFAPEGMNPTLNLSAHNHDFGGVSTGAKSIFPIRITNTGKDTLEIRNITTTNPVFSVGQSLLNIAPNDSLLLNVNFVPTQRIAYTDSLTFTTNDPRSRNVIITLSGQGQRPPTPQINLSTPSINFGDLLAGSRQDTSLILANEGGQTLIITEITASDTAFVITPSQLEIPPEEQATLAIRFIPDEAKTYIDSLTFTTNDPNRQHITVSLRAQVEAPPKPQIAVFPDVLNLGDIFFKSTLDTALIISNEGQTPLNITRISASHLELLFSDAERTIAPGESTRLPITLQPSEPDTLNAILILETNDPDKPQFQVSFRAHFTNWPTQTIPGPVLLDLDTREGNQNTTDREVRPDQRFTMHVYSTDLPHIDTYSIDVIFDPTMLEFVDFSIGDIAEGGFPLTTVDNGVVNASAALFGANDKGGSKSLAILGFRSKANFSDSTYIAVTQLFFRKADGDTTRTNLNVIATVRAASLIGDFDNDGSVGFTDFIQFASAFGKSGSNSPFDLDGDGSVGFPDFLIFARAFGGS